MTSKDSDEPIQREPITRSSGGSDAPPDSPADEDGTLSPTDMRPSSQHGVGESTGRRGEDIEDSDGKEAGRKDVGKQGKAQRPAGTSDSRDVTSVDPDNP